MARCKDCAWFPWKPGADLSGLPAMRCHPDLPMRRWGNAGAETTCERYKAAKPVEPPPQPEPKPAHEPPVEAPAPAKPKPRTKRKG